MSDKGSSEQVQFNRGEIPIPPGFLEQLPSEPLIGVPISFADSDVPEYAGKFALTIDNVLSHEECTQLIKLAESSVPRGENDSPWAPALLRLTPGLQVASKPGYRESGRILWHNQEIVDRICKRCATVEGLQSQLSVVPQQYGKSREGEWQFRRVNDRMSFLRYTQGQFFKPHCDGPYFYDAHDTEFQTHYTLQLYLNDSQSDDVGGDGVVGGATSFLSRDRKRRVDVHPKAGSILLFQHEGLLHEGAIVKEGIKFTLRGDILYEWVKDRFLNKK